MELRTGAQLRDGLAEVGIADAELTLGPRVVSKHSPLVEEIEDLGQERPRVPCADLPFVRGVHINLTLERRTRAQSVDGREARASRAVRNLASMTVDGLGGEWRQRLARAEVDADTERQSARQRVVAEDRANDLARIARIGTVDVPELFAVRQWCDLWQAESRVMARLASGVGLP